MRIYFPPVFLLLIVFSVPEVNAQDSTLFRSERPIAAKISFEGVGLDLSMGRYIALDVTTFLLTTSARARILLFQNNATPFFGVGFGSSEGGFGGNSANQWVSGHIGWEHSYEHVLVQMLIQTTLMQSNRYGFTPFLFNLSVGYRL